MAMILTAPIAPLTLCIMAILLPLFSLATSPLNHPLRYTLTTIIPHHASLFTQGLQFSHGYLYESAGNYGQSTIQIIHPDTGLIPLSPLADLDPNPLPPGKIVLQRKLEPKYFGILFYP
jgi:glutamine cyclotransferase